MILWGISWGELQVHIAFQVLERYSHETTHSRRKFLLRWQAFFAIALGLFIRDIKNDLRFLCAPKVEIRALKRGQQFVREVHRSAGLSGARPRK